MSGIGVLKEVQSKGHHFRGSVLNKPKQRVFITYCIVARRNGQLYDVDQKETATGIVCFGKNQTKRKNETYRGVGGMLWGKKDDFSCHVTVSEIGSFQTSVNLCCIHLETSKLRTRNS